MPSPRPCGRAAPVTGRARKAPWRKGDTSGHIQTVVELRVDCDGDTLLVLVEQTGVACHTGRHNCFFRAIRDGELETIAPMKSTWTSIGKDNICSKRFPGRMLLGSRARSAGRRLHGRRACSDSGTPS